MRIHLFLLLGALLLTGCASSTAQRAGIIAGAGGAGALAGSMIAKPGNKLGGAAIGGLAGAGITALLLGPDGKVYQQGLDDGYTLASSDAIKRLYWSKQALEAPREGGRMSYYTMEESGTTPDGRKLAPERIAVPIFEPTPKP